MAVPKVIQPHPRGRGWNFTQHRAHGYQGGDDFEVAAGRPVKSPVTGFARYSKAGKVIIITPLAGGRTIYVREITRLYGAYPRMVSAGKQIAYASAKWPHYDTTDSKGNRASIMGRVAAYAAQEKAKAAQYAKYRLIGAYLNERGFTKTPTATSGIRGLSYWNGIRKWGARHGLAGKRGAIIEADLYARLK